MRINLPYQLRAALYVLIALGTPVSAYLLNKNVIGELELSLWSGLVTAVTAMAALNVSNPEEDK